VRIAPLASWPVTTWDAVENEGGRIVAMLGTRAVAVERFDAPVDLRAARRNRFLSPLRG
jgi:hypothetical protein